MAHMVREQDQALDEISIHVERIRHTGQLMHDEFAEQVRTDSKLHSACCASAGALGVSIQLPLHNCGCAISFL